MLQLLNAILIRLFWLLSLYVCFLATKFWHDNPSSERNDQGFNRFQNLGYWESELHDLSFQM